MDEEKIPSKGEIKVRIAALVVVLVIQFGIIALLLKKMIQNFKAPHIPLQQLTQGPPAGWIIVGTYLATQVWVIWHVFRKLMPKMEKGNSREQIITGIQIVLLLVMPYVITRLALLGALLLGWI